MIAALLLFGCHPHAASTLAQGLPLCQRLQRTPEMGPGCRDLRACVEALPGPGAWIEPIQRTWPEVRWPRVPCGMQDATCINAAKAAARAWSCTSD